MIVQRQGWWMAVVLVMFVMPGCKRQAEPRKLPSETPAPAKAPASQPATPAQADTDQAQLPPGHPPISGTPQPTSRPAGIGGETATEWKGHGVSWTIPAGWEQIQGSNMRFATLKPIDAPDAPEIAVSHFPGDVGGMLANVNRWRGQIGLPPVSEDALPEQNTPLKVGDIDATLTDIGGDGSATQQLLTVSIPHGGRTWFVKMVGSAEQVSKYRDGFLEFAQSIRFSTAGSGHP